MGTRLSDKVALVTGTSPNIGGGIAEALAHEGAAIVAVDSRADNATDCARAIEAAGGRALGLTCDVCDEVQVRATVDVHVHYSIEPANDGTLVNRWLLLDIALPAILRPLRPALVSAFDKENHRTLAALKTYAESQVRSDSDQ